MGRMPSQSCPELDWPSWLGNSHPTVLDQTGALFSRMWWYSSENVGLNHFKVLPAQRFCHPQGRISSYLSIAQRWPGQPDTVCSISFMLALPHPFRATPALYDKAALSIIFLPFWSLKESWRLHPQNQQDKGINHTGSQRILGVKPQRFQGSFPCPDSAQGAAPRP